MSLAATATGTYLVTNAPNNKFSVYEVNDDNTYKKFYSDYDYLGSTGSSGGALNAIAVRSGTTKTIVFGAELVEQEGVAPTVTGTCVNTSTISTTFAESGSTWTLKGAYRGIDYSTTYGTVNEDAEFVKYTPERAYVWNINEDGNANKLRTLISYGDGATQHTGDFAYPSDYTNFLRALTTYFKADIPVEFGAACLGIFDTVAKTYSGTVGVTGYCDFEGNSIVDSSYNSLSSSFVFYGNLKNVCFSQTARNFITYCNVDNSAFTSDKVTFTLAWTDISLKILGGTINAGAGTAVSLLHTNGAEPVVYIGQESDTNPTVISTTGDYAITNKASTSDKGYIYIYGNPTITAGKAAVLLTKGNTSGTKSNTRLFLFNPTTKNADYNTFTEIFTGETPLTIEASGYAVDDTIVGMGASTDSSANPRFDEKRVVIVNVDFALNTGYYENSVYVHTGNPQTSTLSSLSHMKLTAAYYYLDSSEEIISKTNGSIKIVDLQSQLVVGAQRALSLEGSDGNGTTKTFNISLSYTYTNSAAFAWSNYDANGIAKKTIITPVLSAADYQYKLFYDSYYGRYCVYASVTKADNSTAWYNVAIYSDGVLGYYNLSDALAAIKKDLVGISGTGKKAVITFQNGENDTTALDIGDQSLDINFSCTLSGNLTGASTNTLIKVASGCNSLTLDGLTAENTSSGAIISNPNVSYFSALNIQNSTLKHTSAAGNGVIYWSTGTGTINIKYNTTITGGTRAIYSNASGLIVNIGGTEYSALDTSGIEISTNGANAEAIRMLGGRINIYNGEISANYRAISISGMKIGTQNPQTNQYPYPNGAELNILGDDVVITSGERTIFAETTNSGTDIFTFTMTGGSITSTGSTTDSAAIYLNIQNSGYITYKSKSNISGGSIIYNAAGGTGTAISQYTFYGTITIGGATEVTSNGVNETISAKNLTINGGSVTNTGTGAAIRHNGSSSTVISIKNTTTGDAPIVPVISAAANNTIYIATGGRIEISGGNISNNTADKAVICNWTGYVIISGGTITQSGNGNAIYNNSTLASTYNSVDVKGGTITAAGTGNAIQNANTGTVSITAGTITSAGTGNAIYNANTGTVTISGGTVQNTGAGHAINNNCTTGKAVLNISGETTRIIGSGTNNKYAIYNGNGEVNISGGTLTNSSNETFSNVVYNAGKGDGSITGNITISGGTIRHLGTASAVYNFNTSAEITVSDGVIESVGGHAIFNNAEGTVNIQGGTMNSSVINIGKGTMNISGGTMNGYVRNYKAEGKLNISGNAHLRSGLIISGTVSISGGIIDDVTNETSSKFTISSYGATLNISGGKIYGHASKGAIGVDHALYMTDGEIICTDNVALHLEGNGAIAYISGGTISTVLEDVNIYSGNAIEIAGSTTQAHNELYLSSAPTINGAIKLTSVNDYLYANDDDGNYYNGSTVTVLVDSVTAGMTLVRGVNATCEKKFVNDTYALQNVNDNLATAAAGFIVYSGENPAYSNAGTGSLSLGTVAIERVGYTLLGYSGTENATTAEYAADGTITITAGQTKKLYAVWQANEYTINFNANGGTGDDMDSIGPIGYEIETTLPTNAFTRSGYTFDGWNTAANGSGTPYADGAKVKQIAGTITLYAQWKAVSYNIGYDLDGGVLAQGESNPQSYFVTTATFTLKNPTKTGYTFDGWTYEGQTTPQKEISITLGSTGDKAYTANWSLITYKLTYTLNGGAVDGTNPTGYTVTTATFELKNPTKAGYTFDGWTYEGQTTPQKEISITLGSTGDKAYTANWSLITYNVTYTLNGGAVDGTNPTGYTVTTATFTLKNPTKTGYTFIGWSGYGLTGNNNQTVTIPLGSTENRSYTANWEIITYTYIYDYQGATGGNTAYSVQFTIENYATVNFATPVKTGYEFDGWYNGTVSFATCLIDAEGNLVLDTSIPESNRVKAYFDALTLSQGNTFFAKWTAGLTQISFNLNGGDSDTNYVNYTIAYDKAAGTRIVPAGAVAPEKTGYTFAGWNTAADGKGTTIAGADGLTDAAWAIADATLIVYAKWTANSYELNYKNLKGATHSNAKTHVYGTETTLTSPAVPDGYNFVGWALTENGATITKIGATEITAKQDVYAKWTTISYKLTYDLDGGAVATANPETYDVEQTFTLNNPTKTGYTFAGWTYAGQTSPLIKVTIAKGTTGKYDFVANWTAEEYTLTYKNLKTGATHSNAAKHVYGTETTLTSPAVPDGYNFVGWALTENGATITKIGATEITAKQDVYAKWTKISYRIEYDLDGGAVATANRETYNVEQSFTLNNPTRTGYTFAGWTINDETTPQATITVAAGNVGNLKFTAHWTAITYFIKLDGNGGKLPEDSSPIGIYDAIYDQAFNAPTDVYTKYGHRITGWNTNANGSGTSELINLTTEQGAQVTIYAQWEPDKFNVIFNTSNADPGLTLLPQEFTFGDTKTLTPLSGISKAGYTFAGWATASGSSEVAYADGASYTMNTEGATLYSVWTANTNTPYVLSYYQQNVENDDYTFVSQETKYGTTDARISVEANKFTGFALKGEYTDTISGAGTSIIIVKYDRIKYNVATGNGGIGEGTQFTTSPTGSYRYGATVTIYAQPHEHYKDLIISIDDENILNNGQELTGNTFTMPSNDVYVFLMASKKNYTISFNENGGSAVTDITKTWDSTVSAPTAPTKTGYDFDGWYESTTFAGNAYSFTVMPKGNITLNAKWKAKTYTVTYNVGAYGNALAADTATFGEAFEPKPAVSNTEGRYFGGWQKNGVAFGNVEAWSIDDDVELVAVWNEYQTYAVTFVGGDGTTGTAPTENNHKAGDKFNLPANTFTKTGYHFTTWSDGTAIYAVDDEYTMTESAVTFTAQWEANAYTVRFNGNGKTSGEMSGQSFVYGVAQLLNANRFSKTGHTFAGWATEQNGAVVYENGVSVNKLTTGHEVIFDLFAVWTADEYTLFYKNLKNATHTNAATHTYGGAATPLTAPSVIAGYTFAGWSLTKDGATITEIGSLAITADQDIYAVWTPKTDTAYQVEHYLQNLENDDYTIDTAAPERKTGTTDATTAATAKTTFAGFTAKDITQATIAADGSTVVKVYYDRNRFDATFVVDDDKATYTGTLTFTNLKYGTTLTAPAVTAKAGYVKGNTNGGWDKEIVVLTATVTYTAQLSAIVYDIDYDLDGGAVSGVNPASYTVETATFTLINPTKTGYDFAGWTFGENAPRKTMTIEVGTTGDFDFTATWTAQTYTLTYENVRGTNNNATTHTYNAATPLTDLAEVAGYTFAGWSLTEGGATITAIGATAITANQKVYAKWTAIDYTIAFFADDGTTPVGNPMVKNYGAEVTAPTAPEKAGYRFAGWVKLNTTEVLTAIPSVTASASYKAAYIKEYVISVEGGAISGQTGTTVHVDENGSVTVRATPGAGAEFKHWVDSEGNVVSTQSEYTFSASDDISLKAVYQEILPPEKDGLSGGAIAGIVIACMVALGAGAFIALKFKIKKRA